MDQREDGRAEPCFWQMSRETGQRGIHPDNLPLSIHQSDNISMLLEEKLKSALILTWTILSCRRRSCRFFRHVHSVTTLPIRTSAKVYCFLAYQIEHKASRHRLCSSRTSTGHLVGAFQRLYYESIPSFIEKVHSLFQPGL